MPTNTSKMASAFLALAVVSCVSAVPAAFAADPVCGDVNQSGNLSTSDALLVLKKAVGQPVGLACPALAAPLKTGQTTCHNDNGDPASCSASGADGETQRGAARAFTDNGDGTITDTKTGLMWEKLSDDGSIHDKDNAYSWADAIDGKVSALNTTNFAGHNDWRLPNISELRTLLDLGASNPAAWPAFHTACSGSCTVLTCSCTPANSFWTSTEYAGGATNAWVIEFVAGIESFIAKTTTTTVRGVRGGY